MRGGAVLFALLFFPACGCDERRPSDDPDEPDAGSDAGPIDPTDPQPPTAPAPPAAPRWTPCPPGWTEIPDRGACDPWPAGAPAACADDEAHFPGGAGCERIGPACPVGDFADDLPADAIHVRPGAVAGDGTAGRPFGSIGEALAVASDGAVVALSRGEHVEPVELDADVEIRGACVADTTIASPVPANASIQASSGAPTLRHVTISGAGRGVVVSGADATLRLESAVVRGAAGGGILVEAGALEAERLVVSDTRSAPDGSGGVGLEVRGGRVDLAWASLERNRTEGIRVEGAPLHAADVAVWATLPMESEGTYGYGLYAAAGASCNLERTAIGDSRGYGLRASGVGASVAVRDALIRGGDPDGVYEAGVVATQGAAIDLSRAWIDRPPGLGLQADGAGTTLLATDVVVSEVRATGAGGADDGLGVQQTRGAGVLLRRVGIVRAEVAGILVEGPGTNLDASDIRVAQTHPGAARLYGRGLVAYGGAQVTVARAVFEENHAEQILVLGEGTTLDADDLFLSEALAETATGELGIGIQVSGGASVTLDRARLERCRAAGLAAFDPGTTLTGEDVAVVEMMSEDSDGMLGLALQTANRAEMTITRVALERARSAAAVAYDRGVLILSDVAVDSTLERACAETTCARLRGGSGFAAVDGGRIEATRFRIAGSALCGVQIARGGEMDLADGEISRNPVGANVQDASFDLDRLRTGVLYRDNGLTLDATTFPLPDALGEGEL